MEIITRTVHEFTRSIPEHEPSTEAMTGRSERCQIDAGYAQRRTKAITGKRNGSLGCGV